MEANRVLPWVRLKAVPGVGDMLFRRLITALGSPEAVFSASDAALQQVDGMSPRLAAAIRRQRLPESAVADVERALAAGCTLLTQNDPGYPKLLLEIPDPPPLLNVLGSLALEAAAIAVVGSRSATGYGLDTTRRLSRQLAREGVIVISGMARGIDTAAHEGALDGGCQTVAVMGCGLGTVYPPENHKLFQRIVRNGAVVSEFPFSAGPDPHHFPRRNRIISGLALGVVVVEATRRSGSLITARLALDQGREVFAVPGSIHSFKSSGTHSLIKQGARLVESVADIFDELPMLGRSRPAAGRSGSPQPTVSLTDEERVLIQAIGPYEVQFDELVRKLSISAARLSGLLLNLELKGVLTQSAGKRFTVNTR